MKKIFLCFLFFLALGLTNKALGFDGGNGTEAEPYLISTPEHLVELFYYLGNTNVHFKLKNDIDLTTYLAVGGAGHNDGAGWNPIGNASNKFSGKFNGAGFKITGLWIDRSSTDAIGLFAYTDNANFTNLGIEIAISGIKGSNSVGGLVGICNRTTINNCYATGNVSSNGYNVGGLVGATPYGQVSIITNCYSTGDISGNGAVGGLIGSSYATITDCHTTGNISSNGFNVGGLAGTFYTTTINNCYSTGDVSGNENVGGLIGSSGAGTNTISVKNSYATGNINGNTSIGGLVGDMYTTTTGGGSGSISINNSYATGSVSGNYDNIGGLVGNASIDYGTLNITECYAKGNINGANRVGGMVGRIGEGPTFGNCKITNCYATIGNISGNSDVGGLIGRNSARTITNCYATGKVSGNENVGGFIGFNGSANTSIVNSSFFDYQTTEQLYAIGGGSSALVTGKFTAEMKTKSTFTSVGWDFSTTWNINEGITYPFFNGSVGINEPIQNVNVQLYPNPTTGELRVESRKLKIRSVEIFDVYGKSVLTSSETTLNIAHLSAGVYFVKIYTEQGEIARKVLKE